MPDSLEAIQSFWSTQEAYLAKNRLEAEGIRSFLSDESVTALGVYTIGIGGIKLLVNQADAERASEILDHEIEAQSPESPPHASAEEKADEAGALRGEDRSRERIPYGSDEEEPGSPNAFSALRTIKRPLLWLMLSPILVGLFFAGVEILRYLKDLVANTWM